MSVLGTLLYIANHLSYKPRDDLIIYKKSELDSTFVEIISSKKSNITTSMDAKDFN